MQVIEPESIVNVVNYDEESKCYIISLKRADHSQNMSFSKIPNLDVITKYLTWGDKDFQEGKELWWREFLCFCRSISWCCSYTAPDLKDPKDVSQIIDKIEKLLCEDKNETLVEQRLHNGESGNEESSAEIGTYGFARRYKNKISSFEVLCSIFVWK